MGKDIEMYAEVFDGGRWRPAEPLIENEFHDPDDDRPDPELAPQSLDYWCRNRELFEILTDAIAAPRGLPGDLSPEIEAFERPRREDGLFDHGWLSLEEILAFDWDAVHEMTSRFDADLAPLFDDNPLGFPFSRWPEGRAITEKSMMEGGVAVRWQVTNAILAGPDFMDGVLSKLRSYGPPDAVRLVFWFH
jgi:hypothetical protein